MQNEGSLPLMCFVFLRPPKKGTHPEPMGSKLVNPCSRFEASIPQSFQLFHF